MTKEILKKHVNNKLSIRKIALRCNISPGTVRYYLKKYSLRTTPERKEPKIKKCAICGETDPTKFYGRKSYTCGQCHNRYTMLRGQENRAMAINQLGGKCVVCKFDKYPCSLDIHHIKPSEKDPNFRSLRSWSLYRIILELKKCVLLCRNCHAALHGGFIKIKSLFEE